jgi:pentatricopeptide repeat protein
VEKAITMATQDKLHRVEWGTYIAHAHAVQGNLHKAWNVLDPILKENHIVPSSLPDLIQFSARFPEFLHRGLDLFHDAQRAGLALAGGVYTEIVRGMRRAKEVDRMLEFLRAMRTQGQKLDAMTYHYVLDGIRSEGVARAREVLHEVRLHGVVSDYIAFNKVIQVGLLL